MTHHHNSVKKEIIRQCSLIHLETRKDTLIRHDSDGSELVI